MMSRLIHPRMLTFKIDDGFCLWMWSVWSSVISETFGWPTVFVPHTVGNAEVASRSLCLWRPPPAARSRGSRLRARGFFFIRPPRQKRVPLVQLEHQAAARVELRLLEYVVEEAALFPSRHAPHQRQFDPALHSQKVPVKLIC